MSDVRVTSTGEVFFKIDSQIAALLMAAFPASFEPAVFNKPASVTAVDPAAVTFGVRKNLYNDRPEVFMTQGSLVETFQGEPALLEKGYTFAGKARRVPSAEIIERYRAAYDAQIEDDKARYRARDGARGR